MEKIRLTREEKRVFMLVYNKQDRPNELSEHDYSSCIRSLERKGLVHGRYDIKGIVVDTQMSDFGKDYMFFYPKLTNPISWTKIAAIGSIVSAIGIILGLFLGCVYFR